MSESVARLVDVFHEAAAVHDFDDNIIGANDAYARMLGYDSAVDVVGLHVSQLLHTTSMKDRDRDARTLREQAKPLLVTRTLVRKDGTTIKAFLLKTFVSLDGRTCVLMSFIDHEPVDVSGPEDSLRWQAHHDQLTGLNNRHGMNSALEEHPERVFPGDVWSIDLRNLKGINDTYGHHVGDEYLTAFASQLQRLGQSARVVCARWGGDEFVVVASDDQCEGVQRGLDSIIGRRVSLSVGDVVMNASTGRSRATGLADFHRALRDADTTMIAEKRDGGLTSSGLAESVSRAAAAQNPR